MIETSVFLTSYDDRGFIHTRVKAGAIISLDDAKANTEAVQKLSGENTFPILVDIREINSITREARSHFSMRGRKAAVNAIAMIISSPTSIFIGNIYLLINRPTVPTQLVGSEKDAVTWLTTFPRPVKNK